MCLLFEKKKKRKKKKKKGITWAAPWLVVLFNIILRQCLML